MERSLFYICCGRQSNQVGKCQYADQDHHGPEMETKQFCLNSSAYVFYKSDTAQWQRRQKETVCDIKALHHRTSIRPGIHDA